MKQDNIAIVPANPSTELPKQKPWHTFNELMEEGIITFYELKETPKQTTITFKINDMFTGVVVKPSKTSAIYYVKAIVEQLYNSISFN
jgi:hypothetical protein